MIVATDDERIADAVRAFGGAAVMTRADHVSGTDRIAEVVAALPCRAVVNVQGDEPLIEPDTIDAAVAPLLDDADARDEHGCRPLADADEFRNPHVVKVVTDDRGLALYFSRAPIPFPRDNAAGVPTLARAHIGLYVYRRDTLLRLAALPAVPAGARRVARAAARAGARHPHPRRRDPPRRGRRGYARRPRTCSRQLMLDSRSHGPETSDGKHARVKPNTSS